MCALFRSAGSVAGLLIAGFGVIVLLSARGERSEQVAFAPPSGQIIVVQSKMNVAQAQVTAVPLGEIPSAPASKSNFNGDPRNPVWKIEGKWETTSDDARRAAQLQAQEELVAYLRSQEPPLKWVPPLSFIGDRQKKLVTRSEEETHDFPEIGTMRRFVLEMTLPTDARQEIWRHEREAHARERMLFLAKILAGLVSLLAATAGYLRLDELTKGYYSGWLRLGAAGLLGVAAIAMALLG